MAHVGRRTATRFAPQGALGSPCGPPKAVAGSRNEFLIRAIRVICGFPFGIRVKPARLHYVMMNSAISFEAAEAFKVTPSRPARRLQNLQKQAHALGFHLVPTA